MLQRGSRAQASTGPGRRAYDRPTGWRFLLGARSLLFGTLSRILARMLYPINNQTLYVSFLSWGVHSGGVGRWRCSLEG
jgi:hypothetical protein